MVFLSQTLSKLRLPLLAFASIALAACSTTTTQSFNVSKNSNVESSRIAVGADFGKYDRLLAGEMGIYFPTDSAPSTDDQQRIRQIFRKAFLAELSGYQIVNEKGATTLEVQASLIDLRHATGAEASGLSREVRSMAKPGALVFLMELKDSVSEETLGRAADSAVAPTFSTSSDTRTDWDAIESAAAHWAGLFRQFLDINLNK